MKEDLKEYLVALGKLALWIAICMAATALLHMASCVVGAGLEDGRQLQRSRR